MVQGWDGIGWDGMGWDGMALAEGGVGRGLWSLKMVARLAAASVSGGNWLLQGRCKGRLAANFGRCRSLWRQLAAAGPLQGHCTRPSFNGVAAVEHSLCFSQVMLLLF